MNFRFAPWRYPHLFKLWQQRLADGLEHQLDRWLGQQFRQHKQFGKKDRNAYREAFFAAARFLQLAQALELSYQNPKMNLLQWDASWQANSNNIDPAAFWYWVLLRSGFECPAPNELSDGAERLAYFEEVAKHWPETAALSAQQLLWQGFRPSWNIALSLRQQTSQWSEKDLQSFIVGCNQTAPICIRPQHCSAEELAAVLANEGVQTQAANFGLVTTSPIQVQNSAAYLNGNYELQDTASQALASSVNLTNKQTLWDVCAGAGGKSLAFANIAPKAHILASDIRTNALKQLSQRRARGGFKTINSVQHDACEALPESLIPHNGFDWIFIDAPCSAAGTWRRSADVRWRMDGIDELLKLQQTILLNAAQYLKPKGHLVYATCSWLVEENEAQVKAFLAQAPQFKLITQECVGSPIMNADTMFYAKLQRA